jgi:hypothetical protein
VFERDGKKNHSHYIFSSFNSKEISMQIIIGLLVHLFLLLTASSVAVVDLVIVTKTILDDYVT